MPCSISETQLLSFEHRDTANFMKHLVFFRFMDWVSLQKTSTSSVKLSIEYRKAIILAFKTRYSDYNLKYLQ